MGKKYIQDLYASENRPKDIAIEAEEELDEEDKDVRRKKATGDDNIPVDLLKELGDSGLKIMIALGNKMCMTGDSPKDYITKKK
jgi:hypothetical protein